MLPLYLQKRKKYNQYPYLQTHSDPPQTRSAKLKKQQVWKYCLCVHCAIVGHYLTPTLIISSISIGISREWKSVESWHYALFAYHAM